MIKLPDYYYNLLYIIDLIELERDWGSGIENENSGGGGRV